MNRRESGIGNRELRMVSADEPETLNPKRNSEPEIRNPKPET